MKLFGFTKLSVKLLVFYFVILGVSLIGLFAVFEIRGYNFERNNLVVDLHELIEVQTAPITSALWEYDTDRIGSFLAVAGQLRFVQGLSVSDSVGNTIQTYGDIETLPKKPKFQAQKSLVFKGGEKPETLGFLRIIVHDRIILGELKQRLVRDAVVFFCDPIGLDWRDFDGNQSDRW